MKGGHCSPPSFILSLVLLTPPICVAEWRLGRRIMPRIVSYTKHRLCSLHSTCIDRLFSWSTDSLDRLSIWHTRVRILGVRKIVKGQYILKEGFQIDGTGTRPPNVGVESENKTAGNLNNILTETAIIRPMSYCDSFDKIMRRGL